jgi:hypothetical protein
MADLETVSAASFGGNARRESGSNLALSARPPESRSRPLGGIFHDDFHHRLRRRAAC